MYTTIYLLLGVITAILVDKFYFKAPMRWEFWVGIILFWPVIFSYSLKVLLDKIIGREDYERM